MEKLSLFIVLISTKDFHHFYYTSNTSLGYFLFGDVSVVTVVDWVQVISENCYDNAIKDKKNVVFKGKLSNIKLC